MTKPVELATREWRPTGRSPASAARLPLAVLVHGLTGWHQTWWRVAPALAERGWRVLAVDQRGHGRSPRIEGGVGIEGLVADLAAAIERALGPADVVIGHSLGAAVTAELAHRRPELVARVVLEDPPAMVRTHDPEWLGNVKRELYAAVTDPEAEIARELAENPDWLEHDARQDVEGRALADAHGLMASLGQATGSRILELAPTLTVPALYLLADEERSAFPAEARRQLEAQLPPSARLVTFASGHTIHRDRFDEYLATILDWLDS